MGKSGTYKKKSALTGTEKKTSKLAAKEAKVGEKYRTQGAEIFSKIGSGQDYLSDMLQKQNAPGGQPDQNYQRFYEPIRQESQRQFQQNVLPDIMHQFGRSDSSRGGSALNQALAAAGTNLQSQLNAQLAQYGMQQQQNQMQAASQLQQTGMPQAQLSLAREKNLYIPKGENIGTQLLVGAAEGAAEGGTKALVANAAAGAAGSSRDIKDNIVDYEKGLELVREMDVKQYNYIVPDYGKMNDRIGLIAEDVPEEIRTKLNGINAVDVYGLVSILVNCVKQLDEKVKLLEMK